jgi:phosphatidylglycerol:prolipoprotein diacylglycerol transferase
MRRVLFKWRGASVYSYPFMLYMGIVLGVIAGTYAAGLRGLDQARVYTAMLLLVAPALVGSRLLFVASHWKTYRDNRSLIWRRTEGGAALYGGLITAALVSLPLLWILRTSIGAFWDAAAITLLVGMIFTKMGCLLNGCCAGRPTTHRLACHLPNVRGIWCRRVPSQLLEAGLAALLLMGVGLTWSRHRFDGELFLYIVAAYALGRWGLEFSREDVDRVGGLSLHRTISVLLAAISLGCVVVLTRHAS